MAHFVVLGAGRQGTAVGAYLLEHVDDAWVTFVDTNEAHLEAALVLQRSQDSVSTQTFDVVKDRASLESLAQEADCMISCVPYFLNEALTDVAIDHGACFCDLGGNKGTVGRQLRRHKRAEAAGVTVVPDSGLAPGLLNVLAERWRNEWEVQRIRLFCGGLPQRPQGILRHTLTFSIWGLLNEYFDECEVSRDGRVQTIEGLSDVELLDDLPLRGTFEAFATSGGASLGPSLYASKGIDYEYKTLRYPGHRDIYAGMRELGLFDIRRRTLTINLQSITASRFEVSAALMADAVPSDGQDLVIARAEVHGSHQGKPLLGRIDLLDYADDRFTAMERTTGFPTAVLAAASTGAYEVTIPKGAFVPFQVIPPSLMIKELSRAGVTGITETVVESPP